MAIVLNKRQQRAALLIKQFIETPATNSLNEPLKCFLLKGPAGSGKTSVITNVFHRSPLKIAFCAFTNKATQVLKNISDKFQVEFNAEFMTIHKLLNLKISYDRTGNLKFIFHAETCDIAKYDVIICDECSTISTELFGFIQSADMIAKSRGKMINFIFIGDEWQLPPVNEKVSVIFTRNCPMAELQAVMRSDNDVILSINTRMIQMPINQDFLDQFPHNIIPTSCFLSADNFLLKYIKYLEQDRDVICITYTVKNCDMINTQVQHMLNANAGRVNLPNGFYPGDRCCLVNPFEPVPIVEHEGIFSQSATLRPTQGSSSAAQRPPQSPTQSPIQSPILNANESDNWLYNGIIYDIVEVRDVKFRTFLNTLAYTPQFFNAQLLTIKKPVSRANPTAARSSYTLVHLNPDEIRDTLAKCGAREPRKRFLQIQKDFYAEYPQITHGYCITLYKSQGSEWETVFVNLLSIIYSCKKAKQLYRAAYSAISRASKRLYVKY